jgi:hypothetical protein
MKKHKSLSQRWKEHYASFLPKEERTDIIEAEFEPEEIADIEIVATSNKKTSKSQLKKLLLAQELLRQQKLLEEQKKRALDIRNVDQSNYVVAPNSIESYLLRVLSPTDAPIHINNIIEQMEAIGWKTSSKYHKYSRVYSALKLNYALFTKVGKATFKLREGFRGRKPIKTTSATLKAEDNKLITIKDISYDLAKRYADSEGIYPSKLYHIMKHIGYNCNYSSVYRAMQSELFTRDGFWYKPV